jgi:hypothetical protein
MTSLVMVRTEPDSALGRWGGLLTSLLLKGSRSFELVSGASVCRLGKWTHD